jgi:hypothetical protein
MQRLWPDAGMLQNLLVALPFKLSERQVLIAVRLGAFVLPFGKPDATAGNGNAFGAARIAPCPRGQVRSPRE